MNAPVQEGMERVFEVKTRVEGLKTRVRNLQLSLQQAKETAEGQWPRQAGTWKTYQDTKKDHARAVTELSAAKLELTRLSGTTGHDPRWRLLREAWHVLNDLEEQGVKLSERAEALIDDIEFHVPHSKLHDEAEAGICSTSVPPEPK